MTQLFGDVAVAVQAGFAPDGPNKRSWTRSWTRVKVNSFLEEKTPWEAVQCRLFISDELCFKTP